MGLACVFAVPGCYASAPAVTPPQSISWDQLDLDARRAAMHRDVLPLAQRLFREFDAERYASVTCATCHGPGAANGSFEMPNPRILALHPSGSPEQRVMVEAHPQMVRFMFNHLLPEVRDVMGAAPYDTETGEGFSCYSCHPHASD